VVELPSGIQYSVIKKGDGSVNPGVDSLVTVNYRGMLIDGTEFDSTWAHGAPVSFHGGPSHPWLAVRDSAHACGRSLEGGDSAAAGLRRAWCAAAHRPQQALVFDIELLDIKPPNPQTSLPARKPNSAVCPGWAPALAYWAHVERFPASRPSHPEPVHRHLPARSARAIASAAIARAMKSPAGANMSDTERPMSWTWCCPHANRHDGWTLVQRACVRCRNHRPRRAGTMRR
jgi:hypothetical protein